MDLGWGRLASWRVLLAGIAVGLWLYGWPLDLDSRFYHLGRVLRDLGRVTEAIEAYERAQALKPGYPEVEQDLALLRAAVLPRPVSPARAP
jgi:tetratricopeptide (TPR) repeat protein